MIVRRVVLSVMAAVTAMAWPGAITATADDAGSDDRPRAQTENPYFARGAAPGSGEGLTIGYIAIGDAGVFTELVEAGIRHEADVAGARLITCDSEFDPDLAVTCGRLMSDVGVDGVLNFQVSEADSGRVCSAYGSKPTIAIDIHQPPCELAFVGADNPLAGYVAGEAMGERVRDEHGCRIDTIFVLNAPNTGRVGVDRTEGMIDGFESVCGPQAPDVIHRLDIFNESQAQELIVQALPERPIGGLHAVFAINEFFAFGADEGSRVLGREDEFLFVSQDHANILDRLACDDRWVAATAYFPELYGATLVPAMIDLIRGEDVPPELLTVHEVVTKENLHEFVDEFPDCAEVEAP